MPSGVYKRIQTKKYGMSGKKHSDNSKKIMSFKHLGKTPWLGKKHKKESKIKMSLIQIGRPRTQETKNKLKISMKGINTWMKGKKISEESRIKMGKSRSGEKHWRWEKDRDLLLNRSKRNFTENNNWKKEVKKRDKWECRLLNNECSGRLESHHIFNWIEYPELRFIINNGITLCAFHHPKGREKEKRMIPIFQELLSVSKE